VNSNNDRLRTELDRKLQPPVDVLVNLSLLVADRVLEWLANSPIFASQMQTTLSGMPTEPRLENLYAPATFHELVSSGDQSTVQKADVWDFYRGQAEAAFPNGVIELLEENGAERYSAETTSALLHWTNAIDDYD